MDKRGEIEASWKEFDKNREEREFYNGLEAYIAQNSHPYTPLQKNMYDMEKNDYINGKDIFVSESQLLSLIKESVKNILKEEFNIEYYKDSSDGWVKSLANNGLRMGMTPEEIKYLIQKREKEQNDYEISQFNNTDKINDLRRQGEMCQDKRINGVSYGSNGSIYDDSLWNGH